MYEGEPPPVRTREDKAAIDVWNMLHNGHGAIDWTALPLALEYFGIGDDAEGLIGRLLTIKSHRPPPKEKDD